MGRAQGGQQAIFGSSGLRARHAQTRHEQQECQRERRVLEHSFARLEDLVCEPPAGEPARDYPAPHVRVLPSDDGFEVVLDRLWYARPQYCFRNRLNFPNELAEGTCERCGAQLVQRAGKLHKDPWGAMPPRNPHCPHCAIGVYEPPAAAQAMYLPEYLQSDPEPFDGWTPDGKRERSQRFAGWEYDKAVELAQQWAGELPALQQQERDRYVYDAQLVQAAEILNEESYADGCRYTVTLPGRDKDGAAALTRLGVQSNDTIASVPLPADAGARERVLRDLQAMREARRRGAEALEADSRELDGAMIARAEQAQRTRRDARDLNAAVQGL